MLRKFFNRICRICRIYRIDSIKQLQKISFIGIWIVLFIFGANYIFADTNLIKNGDFELLSDNNFPLYWQTKYWDIQHPPEFLTATGRGETGIGLKVVSPTPNDSHVYQVLEVKPDTLYKISVWIKGSDMGSSDKGANISEVDIMETSTPVKNTAGQWEYTELYGRSSAQQTRATITLRLGAYGHNSKGTVIFDDVLMVEVQEAPPGVNVAPLFNQTRENQNSTGDDQNTTDAGSKIKNEIRVLRLLIFPLLIGLFILIYILPFFLNKLKEKLPLPQFEETNTSFKTKLLRFILQPSVLRSLLILYLTWGVILIILFSKVLVQDGDDISSTFMHVWSDWPFHIGIASVFAYRSPSTWFNNHPMFYGGNLSYPFLMDFISGMLMRLGVPTYLAFLIPSYLFVFIILTGLFLLAYMVLKSRTTAFLAISLFLLSSGLGVYKFWGEYLSGNPAVHLFAPSDYFTRYDSYSWYSGNIIHGILLPQRAFLLGMSLALWSLIGLIRTMSTEFFTNKSRLILILSGLLTGLLPIAHMHSFLAVFVIAGAYCLFSLKHIKKLLYYIIPAGLLSLLLCFTFIFGKSALTQFFRWMPGFTAGHNIGAWLLMWLKLFGIAVPLAIAGYILLWKNLTTELKAFFAAFFILFIVANLVKFQAVEWDNSKIFFWAYLGFSLLASVFIMFLWQKRKWLRLLAIVCVYALISTGILDLEQMFFGEKSLYKMENIENIEMARQIRENTDEMAIFATDTAHNHVIMAYAARPILLGFTGWMGNFGFDYRQREIDLRVMYAGGARAEELFKYYKVSYLVIGPAERYNYRPDENYFKNNCPLAFSSQQYSIYDVRQLSELDVSD